MKRSANLSFLFALFILFSPYAVSAAVTNSVNVESNGEGSSSSVNIQNSVNSTSTSTSNTTVSNHVCVEVNGKKECYDGDENSDINVESNDGNTKVKINGSETDVQVGPNPTAVLDEEEDVVLTPTITPDPTIKQEVKAAHEKVEEAHAKVKQHIKSEEAALSQLMESLQKFLDNLFK